MLQTIGFYAGLYLVVSTMLGIVIGRALRFSGDDGAEHPLVDQNPWATVDARREAWAATDPRSARCPAEFSSPGRVVASR